MKVLVATKEPSVLEVVRRADDVEAVPALVTGRIYRAIPEVQLAIIDYAHLVAQPFSSALIRTLLAEAKLPQCSSDEFLAAPDAFLDTRGVRSRQYTLPEQRTIAFTSYSGGTGKTSLALDTALRFVERTKARALELPAAVFEFTYGGSALQALVGNGPPLLDELISQPELEASRFNGATLYPMQYDRLDLTQRDGVAHYLHNQMTRHVLTVVDTSWPHGLVSDIGAEVDLWVVLTTPRIDAVENARRLQTELSEEYGGSRVMLVVNQMGGFGSSLALMGTRRDLEIPRVRQPGVFFEGRLGREILKHVYDPLWQDFYERGGRRRFRLRKKS